MRCFANFRSNLGKIRILNNYGIRFCLLSRIIEGQVNDNTYRETSSLTDSFIWVLKLEVLLEYLSVLSLTFSLFSASLSSTYISLSPLINRANGDIVYRSLSASYVTAQTT